MTVLVLDNGLDGNEHEIEFVDIGGIDPYFAEQFLVRDEQSFVIGEMRRRDVKTPDILIDFALWIDPDAFFERVEPHQAHSLKVEMMGKVLHFKLKDDMWGRAPTYVLMKLFKEWRSIHRSRAKTRDLVEYLIKKARSESGSEQTKNVPRAEENLEDDE